MILFQESADSIRQHNPEVCISDLRFRDFDQVSIANDCDFSHPLSVQKIVHIKKYLFDFHS